MRVYSDEVYEHILFDGSRHQSIASFPGMDELTILVGGASKSFSWTGGRIGWAMFPTTAEAEMFRNLNINYFSCVPAYNQEGARLGLESPLFAEENRKMIEAFQARRDLVVEGLRQIPGICCQMPKGAFYVFPNVAGVCEQLGIIEAYRRLPAEVRKLTTPSTLLTDVPSFRVPGRHHGPEVLRPDRQREPTFPAALHRDGYRFAQGSRFPARRGRKGHRRVCEVPPQGREPLLRGGSGAC